MRAWLLACAVHVYVHVHVHVHAHVDATVPGRAGTSLAGFLAGWLAGCLPAWLAGWVGGRVGHSWVAGLLGVGGWLAGDGEAKKGRLEGGRRAGSFRYSKSCVYVEEL